MEVCERLEQDAEENERRASLLTISYQFYQNEKSISQSRATHLNSYKHEKVAQQCFDVLTKATQHPISFIGFSAAKFVGAKGSENFINFFKTEGPKSTQLNENSAKNPKPGEKLINSFDTSEKITEGKEIENNTRVIEVEENETKSETQNNDALGASCENSPKSVSKKKMISFFKTINNIESPPSKKTPSRRVQNKSPQTSKNISACSSNRTKSFFANLLENKNKNVNTPKVEENTLGTTNAETDKDTNCAVKLQDIFPDLNNIDPSILACLPIHLRKEASEYLKHKNQTQKSPENATKKVGRPKGSKSKTKEQPNRINNFLINAKANGDSEDFQNCPQCGQLISLEKSAEHKDFHVAQSLQKMISQPANVKRKCEENEVSSKKLII